MKKIVKLLLLFVVPLLFVACSDDEYEDLQIPGKTIEEPVKLTGHVYNEDETCYLGTKLPVINMDRGEGAEIKIKSFPNNISLDEIEYIEKTDLIDKVTSKRGAALYRFNKEAYLEDSIFKL